MALFHWLGVIYGHALLDLLRYTIAAEKTSQPGFYLSLTEEFVHLPTWTPEQVMRYLHNQYRRYESILALGAYHHLLPLKLRRKSVVEQFNVPCFLRAIQVLHIERTPETLTNNLEQLLD
ncbi:MAG: hypothetical protein ABI690_01525 [Chloroflexota bacterium]